MALLPILTAPDPRLKKISAARQAGGCERPQADGRHAGDDVPRARHRPGRAAGRRGCSASSWSTSRARARSRSRCASPIRRSSGSSDEDADLQRGLPVAAGALCRRGAARPRSGCAISTTRTSPRDRRPRACSRPACSTRSTISTACCSSTICRAEAQHDPAQAAEGEEGRSRRGHVTGRGWERCASSSWARRTSPRRRCKALIEAGHRGRSPSIPSRRGPAGRGMETHNRRCHRWPTSRALPVRTPDDAAERGRAGGLRRARRRCRGGRGLWPDPAASRCSMRRASAASTSMPRCCRAGAARRRSSARSWPATPRPASRSCRWTRGSIPARCCCSSELADRRGPNAGELHDALAALGARLIVPSAWTSWPRPRAACRSRPTA